MKDKQKSIGVLTEVVHYTLPDKVSWRRTATPVLDFCFPYLRGRIHSLTKANDPANNALSYAKTVTGRCNIYSARIDRKYEKKLKPIKIDCRRFAVHYDAALDRVNRTVASIPGEPKSMRKRRRFTAQGEREYLYRVRTAIRHALAGNLEAIDSLTKLANTDKGRIGAKTKMRIYQYIRGLTKGKSDLSLLGEDKIDEMIATAIPDVIIPDTTRYSEIVSEKEENSYA